MTDEEYYRKMNQTNHNNTCSWGWDQYWWECDCGAIPVAELKAERERRKASLLSNGRAIMRLWNAKCDACDQRKPDVKPRSDWAPPRPLCDDCWNRWWEANKDELG